MNKTRLYFSIAIFFLLAFSSCQNKSNFKKTQKFYKKHQPDGDFSKFYKIVIINELGNCINCNNKFALQMADSINNPNILFIVSATGARVDISSYINKEQDNIIWDTKLEFNTLEIAKTCAMIDVLNDFQITEVVPEKVSNTITIR